MEKDSGEPRWRTEVDTEHGYRRWALAEMEVKEGSQKDGEIIGSQRDI